MLQKTFRLKTGQLLKEEIEKFVSQEGIQAGVLLSIVAALSKTRLRMAGAEPTNQPIKEWNESMEVVGGTGTISPDGCHIHLSVSDRNGNVYGGHLKDGCVVDITAEVVLACFDNVKYFREFDQGTGWKELVVKK